MPGSESFIIHRRDPAGHRVRCGRDDRRRPVAVRIRAAVVSVGAAVQRRVLGRVWLLGEEFVFAGMGFVVMVPLPGTATLD